MRPVLPSKYHAENAKKVSLAMVVTFSFLLLAVVCNSSDVDADDSGTCGNGLTYTYTESTHTLIIQKTGSGDGAMDNYSFIGGGPWPYTVTNVIIGDGVTTIGDSAFLLRSEIISVDISNSVKTIGKSSFSQCSKITSVNIPDSVTSIGVGAFYHCSNLKSVNIPDSVTSIGDNAFSDCTQLTSISIPSGVSSIGKNTFSYCSNLKSVNIPDSVTSIGDYAFYYDSLTSLEIPDSVTSIGDYAFANCTSLKSVNIPDSVTSIGDYAFENCSKLKSVNIPDSVISIGLRAFNYCYSCLITVDEKNINYSSDSQGILYNKDKTRLIVCPGHKTSVRIPDSVTSIDSRAFAACQQLKFINISSAVTSIGDSAFIDCLSLAAIIVDEDNANYSSDSQGILYNKDKTKLIQCPGCKTAVSIPDSVTSIGSNAFFGCQGSLKFLMIGQGVSSVENNSFYPLFFYDNETLVKSSVASNIVGKTWMGSDGRNLYLKEPGDPIVYVTAGNGGSVKQGPITVPLGTSISVSGNKLVIGSNSIKATPSHNYEFDSWFGIDSISVNSDMVIAACFNLQLFTVEVTVQPVAGGTVSGEGHYESGSMVELSFEADEGWKFYKWNSSQVDIINGSFTMPDQNVTVTAVFIKEGEFFPGFGIIHLLAIALIAGTAVGIVAVVGYKKRAGQTKEYTPEKKSEEYSVAQYQEQIDAKKEELRLLKTIAADENQTVKTVKSANACIPKLESEIRDLEAKKQEASRKGLF